jgi:hypothetical protein
MPPGLNFAFVTIRFALVQVALNRGASVLGAVQVAAISPPVLASKIILIDTLSTSTSRRGQEALVVFGLLLIR